MAKAKVVNRHGYEILKDSKAFLEATARVSPNDKFTFLGRLTFEKVYSERYGWQVILSLWMPDGVYPELQVTDYAISRGRIEICVPEVVARKMRLLR